LKHLYLGELPKELGGGPGTGFTDAEVLAGIDRISKHLEIKNLSQIMLDDSDRRLIRQRRQDEIQSGVSQLGAWYQNNVLYHAVRTNVSRANDVKWDRVNGIFADILLRADEDEEDDHSDNKLENTTFASTNVLGIPLGGSARSSRSPSRARRVRGSVLYPCHRAVLVRSEYFMTMFGSEFMEAQDSPHLHIVPIDCSPAVLEIILTYLYTEKTEFGLDIAVDVLFAADMLFLEKLKTKAAVVISTLGNGTATGMQTEDQREDTDLDIFEILRAAWTTRVQRLEEFAARYIAFRLEDYIDDPQFAEIVRESAARIGARQETDSIELVDDIRYYLSDRFRLRFEDVGFDEAIANDQSQQDNVVIEYVQDSDKSVPVWGSNAPSDEGVDVSSPPREPEVKAGELTNEGVIRTLDGEIAGDEFEQDSANYQILLARIDNLLEKLKLDA
jgi:ankyrin repeat/BTB/POZ domain-containing protein 1